MEKIKIAFIDRDGTLLKEPGEDNKPVPYQVCGLDQFEIIPNTISALKTLKDADVKLVMVTNQDGLGQPINPREIYEEINNHLFKILKSEGIEFLDICECPHFPEDKCDCRKPKLGILDSFLKKGYNIDWSQSCMIGDRDSDMEFAKNLTNYYRENGILLPFQSVKGLKIDPNKGWESIMYHIKKYL